MNCLINHESLYEHYESIGDGNGSAHLALHWIAWHSDTETQKAFSAAVFKAAMSTKGDRKAESFAIHHGFNG